MLITSVIFCLAALASACAEKAPERHHEFEKRNFETIEKIYSLAIYPRNVALSVAGSSVVPEGLFNQNATGRITPVGNFTATVVDSTSENFGQYVTTLKQTAFWQFDKDGAVLRYDAWLPSLRLFTSTLNFGHLGNAIDPPENFKQIVIENVCESVDELCIGGNKQYASKSDCSRFLNDKPYGDADNIWADSVTCRNVHTLLAQVRPNVSPPTLSQ
ncbi:MAG: hypothetical protein LQ342_003659 [Letrouitia transgressa]|nr:MAG: hypothetical protein LQ342_003659 [Letrouitia transgressa]